ncbi:MAG: hypothetical protein AB1689_22540 [Thermodesulfobacteriota bacterium]
MPGVGDIVLKPPIFVTFEQQSETPGWHNDPKFQAALAILQDGSIGDGQALDMLVDTAGSAGQMPASVSQHFKDHWLGRHLDPQEHYWPGVDTAKLIRAGMRHVCESFAAVAQSAAQKPCEYFWVTGRSTGSRGWEIVVAEGTRQITVLFVTPQPRYDPANVIVTKPNPKIRKVFLDAANNVIVKPIEEPI